MAYVLRRRTGSVLGWNLLREQACRGIARAAENIGRMLAGGGVETGASYAGIWTPEPSIRQYGLGH